MPRASDTSLPHACSVIRWKSLVSAERYVGVRQPWSELPVDQGVLEQRIRLRDSGVQLAEHLAFLDAYDAEGAEARADAVIEIDDQSPAQVARDVLGVAGW